MTLYKALFSENFESLKSSDVKQGMVGGIVSPYSVPAEDNVLLAVSTADENSNEIGNKISRLHQKSQYNIKSIASSDLPGFKEFNSRLLKAFQLNNLFSDDTVLQTKLTEFLTYCYASLSRKNGYVIYPELEQAKKVVRIIFTKAQKLGLTFLPIEVENLIKTILLTVLFKLPKD